MESPQSSYSENLSHPHTLSPTAPLTSNESLSTIKRPRIEEDISMFLIPEGQPVGEWPAILDESVIGFPGDTRPARQGVKEMLEVLSILKDRYPLLCNSRGRPHIFWSSKTDGCEYSLLLGQDRYLANYCLRQEWNICVPTDMVALAADALQAHNDRLTLFRPSAMYRLGSLHHHFPHFKFVNAILFFVIVPAQDCHIPCKLANFELGQTGMPFPKLDVFAQSLLDTNNGIDLEDLVDGMNLSMEWGEEHLDLDGHTDVAWANWKIEALEKEGKTLHGWDSTPESRRQIWQSTVSEGSSKAQRWVLIWK